METQRDFRLNLLSAPEQPFDRARALEWLDGERRELVSLLGDLGTFSLQAARGWYDTGAAYFLAEDLQTLVSAAVKAISEDATVEILDDGDGLDYQGRCANLARLVALRAVARDAADELMQGTHAALDKLSLLLRDLLNREEQAA